MQVAPAIFIKKDKRMKRMMVIFILAIPLLVTAQTYYYDKNWKGVEREDFAEYKRILAPSSDSLHYANKYRDYFITGEKQGEGEYITIDRYDDSKSVFDGEQLSYYKNGNVASKLFMKHGKQTGAFEMYFENGLLSKKGTIGENGLEGLYTEFQGDGTICVQVEYHHGQPTQDYYTVSNNLGCVSRYRISDNSPVLSPIEPTMRKTQFVNDIEWEYYVSDGLMVAMANDKVYDYGNFISFPIMINNGTMSEVNFLPENLSADMIDKKGRKKPLEILTRKEYMAKVDRSQSWSKFFAGLGAAATAAAAGTSTSSTDVSTNSSTNSYAYSSYDASANAYGASVGAAVGSGGWGVGSSVSAAHANMHGSASAYGHSNTRTNTSVRTTNYDGAAAYQAYVIERDRVAQYDEALAQEREAHNEGYLRRTTIQPGEKIAGLVYAKKGKGERVSAKLVLNGLEYYFEWKAPK